MLIGARAGPVAGLWYGQAAVVAGCTCPQHSMRTEPPLPERMAPNMTEADEQGPAHKRQRVDEPAEPVPDGPNNEAEIKAQKIQDEISEVLVSACYELGMHANRLSRLQRAARIEVGPERPSRCSCGSRAGCGSTNHHRPGSDCRSTPSSRWESLSFHAKRQPSGSPSSSAGTMCSLPSMAFGSQARFTVHEVVMDGPVECVDLGHMKSHRSGAVLLVALLLWCGAITDSISVTGSATTSDTSCLLQS